MSALISVSDDEIKSIISGLETEVILRYLDDLNSVSSGEDKTQVTVCRFKSEPPCRAHASVGCEVLITN